MCQHSTRHVHQIFFFFNKQRFSLMKYIIIQIRVFMRMHLHFMTAGIESIYFWNGEVRIPCPCVKNWGHHHIFVFFSKVCNILHISASLIQGSIFSVFFGFTVQLRHLQTQVLVGANAIVNLCHDNLCESGNQEFKHEQCFPPISDSD